MAWWQNCSAKVDVSARVGPRYCRLSMSDFLNEKVVTICIDPKTYPIWSCDNWISCRLQDLETQGLFVTKCSDWYRDTNETVGLRPLRQLLYVYVHISSNSCWVAIVRSITLNAMWGFACHLGYAEIALIVYSMRECRAIVRATIRHHRCTLKRCRIAPGHATFSHWRQRDAVIAD